MTKEQLKEKTVWEKLSTTDVSEHSSDKNGLTYLSWAWAWKVLKDECPQATFTFKEYRDPRGLDYPHLDHLIYPDGTAMVECVVSIEGASQSMSLPVMDYRNKAIVGPDSRAVSDSKQRCLVKAIAMASGLGLYIYAGEDLPDKAKDEPVVPKPEPKKKVATKKKASKPVDVESEKVSLTLDVFAEEAEDLECLTILFKENRSVIDKLAVKNPEQHKKVMAAFTSRKNALMGK